MSPRGALLNLREVEKRYGGLPALDRLSLEIETGEILAIVGPNGAGKSTLLKLIAGLLSPTKGAIDFDGVPIAGLAPHQIRRRGIALVLQTPRNFESMTTFDNVVVGAMFGRADGLLGEAAAREAAERALAFVGLEGRAEEPVSHLTLHERRFLELARAIASKPRLLLLDEVMAGLNDAELTTSATMIRSLRDELGITVVWVEHVMKAVVHLAERAVVLNFGRPLAAGPPREVLTDEAVIEAYLGEALSA